MLEPAELPVVAVLLAREQGMQSVVEVVTPLFIKSIATQQARSDHTGVVQVALSDQITSLAKSLRQLMNHDRQLLEEGLSREVPDAVDRVQPEGVQVEFCEPVEGILDKEAANLVATGPVEIYGRAPGGTIAIGEVRSEVCQIVPLRTQVVVNYVEHDGQPILVAGVDKPFESLRTSVGRLHG